MCRGSCETIYALVVIDLASLETKQKADWSHLLAQKVVLNTRAKISIVNVGVEGNSKWQMTPVDAMGIARLLDEQQPDNND